MTSVFHDAQVNGGEDENGEDEDMNTEQERKEENAGCLAQRGEFIEFTCSGLLFICDSTSGRLYICLLLSVRTTRQDLQNQTEMKPHYKGLSEAPTHTF